MEDKERLLTLDEVAKMLGIHIRSLRRYVKNGKLSAVKVPSPRGPYQLMIPEESVKSYLGQGNLVKHGSGCQEPDKSNVSDNLSYNNQEALIQATYRIGWLESQLETTKKMLTEGEAHRQTVLEERNRIAQEKAVLEARVQQLGAAMQTLTKRQWWEFWKPRVHPLELLTSLH